MYLGYHIVFSVSKSEELLKQVNLTNTEANKVNPKVFENDPEEASKSNVAPLNQNNYNPNEINSWSDFTRELNRWINW